MKEIGTVISVKERPVIVNVKRKDACSSQGAAAALVLAGDSMIVEALKTGDPKGIRSYWNS